MRGMIGTWGIWVRTQGIKVRMIGIGVGIIFVIIVVVIIIIIIIVIIIIILLLLLLFHFQSTKTNSLHMKKLHNSTKCKMQMLNQVNLKANK